MSTRHPLTIPDEWILRDDDGSYWCRGLGSPWWVNTPKGDAQSREPIPKDTTTSTQAIIAQCSSSSPSQRWSAPTRADQ